MQSFKPKEVPFFKKLVSSTGLQLGVLILITLIAAQFILNRYSPQKFSQKNSPSQGTFKSEENPNSNNSETDEYSEDTNQDSRPLASVGSDSAEGASISDRAQQLNRTGSGVNEGSGNTTSTNGSASIAGEQEAQFYGKLRVIYAEVPIDMINKFKAQDNPFEFENSNIIRHNFTVREGSGDRQNHWIDLIERLDEVESDSHFGSFEALIDQLNDDERRVLATGLSAQTKMIHHENHLILCHPDAQPIAELVEEITELIDLEPSIRLQVMIDREIFYRQIIYDIEVNRSVKKLRRLMAEYRNTTEDYA
jgi:hypothetical protein